MISHGFKISLSMAIFSISTASFALCPSGPMNAIVVNNDPVLLQQCEPGGGSCTQPQKPTIDLTSPHNGPQSQEVVAVIPIGMDNVTAVVWSVEFIDPVSGILTFLFEGEFLEEFQTPRNGGDTIRTVIPGLLADTEHRYRVAFKEGDDGCCWSARSDPLPNPADRKTDAFSTSWPSHPAGIDLEVEDSFDRSTTEPKYEPTNPTIRNGDGLGPWDLNPSNANFRGLIWQDGIEGTSTGNGSHISVDDSRAFLPINNSPCYTREATNSHVFMETLFELDTTESDDTYNYDLRARLHFNSSMVLAGYYVKLVDGWRGATKPTLRIGRSSGMTLSTLKEITIPHGPQTKCNAEPPLSKTNGQKVWLRGIVKDVGNPLRPEITATAAWGNCPSGNDLSECDHVCSITIIDSDPEAIDFVGVEGMWGMFAHERNIYVDLFRAGSAPSP